MPGLDGIEVTRALAGPGVPDPLRVVIVTTFDLDEYVYGALRAGAVGFLLKDAGPALLVEAVRAASAGDALISPAGHRCGCCDTSPRPRPRDARPARSAAVRTRARGRREAVAKGRTNNEIAAELFISLSTVKTHLASIQNKLDVRNRVEIAAWAWESRIMGTPLGTSRARSSTSGETSVHRGPIMPIGQCQWPGLDIGGQPRAADPDVHCADDAHEYQTSLDRMDGRTLIVRCAPNGRTRA